MGCGRCRVKCQCRRSDCLHRVARETNVDVKDLVDDRAGRGVSLLEGLRSAIFIIGGFFNPEGKKSGYPIGTAYHKITEKAKKSRHQRFRAAERGEKADVNTDTDGSTCAMCAPDVLCLTSFARGTRISYRYLG